MRRMRLKTVQQASACLPVVQLLCCLFVRLFCSFASVCIGCLIGAGPRPRLHSFMHPIFCCIAATIFLIQASFQGMYELFAVVAHKGRSADGGHYMSFVRDDSKKVGPKEEAQWICFDDNDVEVSHSSVSCFAALQVRCAPWFICLHPASHPQVCKTSNITDLKGGGDRDMAYLVFYRFKPGA